jgi:hypothetical protein
MLLIGITQPQLAARLHPHRTIDHGEHGSSTSPSVRNRTLSTDGTVRPLDRPWTDVDPTGTVTAGRATRRDPASPSCFSPSHDPNTSL